MLHWNGKVGPVSQIVLSLEGEHETGNPNYVTWVMRAHAHEVEDLGDSANFTIATGHSSYAIL